MTTTALPYTSNMLNVRELLLGRPAFLSGSSVSAHVYNLPDAYDDIDVFLPNMLALSSTAEHLLHEGFEVSDRFSRVWARWQEYGTNKWHTNSLKLVHPDLGEVNLVHKLVGGHPVTSLSGVLESFDFGLLAIGYDLRLGELQDMRGFLFPSMRLDGPLPMMPNKAEAWKNGFISQYNGLREAGRYAKYCRYGYDMSLVKAQLLEGYQAAAEYLHNRDKPEKQQLADIYDKLYLMILLDEIDELHDASKQIIYLDALDDIMEKLE